MTSRVLPSWPYNRRGMIVRNAKGMTFVIKGDGHLGETPEARRVIALAVLESRNQISERLDAPHSHDRSRCRQHQDDWHGDDPPRAGGASGQRIHRWLIHDGAITVRRFRGDVGHVGFPNSLQRSASRRLKSIHRLPSRLNVIPGLLF